MPSARRTLSDIAGDLQAIGRDFHARGWVFGCSGNFSAVYEHEPLRLAITRSGAAKGALSCDDILLIDAEGEAVGSSPGSPSAEALLHTLLVRVRGAGAVLHTHSVWSTILSDRHFEQDGVAIAGFELLKALAGVRTHEHREWIPILDNDQDIARLSHTAEARLAAEPGAHAFLLRRHGLYTWGRDLAEARRHLEALEFLFEVTARIQA